MEHWKNIQEELLALDLSENHLLEVPLHNSFSREEEEPKYIFWELLRKVISKKGNSTILARIVFTAVKNHVNKTILQKII